MDRDVGEKNQKMKAPSQIAYHEGNQRTCMHYLILLANGADEMSQSKLYSRLRLNPVPESTLSPDVPMPPKNRPAQMDDPVAARRSKRGEVTSGIAASWRGSRQHDLMSKSMHAQKQHKDSQVICIVKLSVQLHNIRLLPNIEISVSVLRYLPLMFHS